MARALTLGSFVASVAATTLDLHLLPKSYGTALCNDGTMSGYYFKAGTNNVWIVHQEGGDWCYDAASCAARAQDLRSSAKWAATKDVGGLLESTDARLAGANKVYLAYCTSDGYAGNAAAAPPTGFHFRGKDVVRAVFDDLMRTHGLGAAAGTQVMYSGCSAGARGVLFNAAAVGAQLSAAVGPNLARYAALLDSAFWVDVAPFKAGVEPFATETRDVFALANASGTIDPACAAVYSGADGWKCLFGEYAVATLKVPFMLHSFQYDLFQLGHDVGNKPATPTELAYAEAFRNLTRASAARDVTPAANTTVFLPACYRHCNTETSTWMSLKTNGFSLEQGVTSWFFGDGTVPVNNTDNCVGFNCGPGC